MRIFPDRLRNVSPGARWSGMPAPAEENSDAVRNRPAARTVYVSRHSVRSTEWTQERSKVAPRRGKQRAYAGPFTSTQRAAIAAGAVRARAASAGAAGQERMSARNGKARTAARIKGPGDGGARKVL